VRLPRVADRRRKKVKVWIPEHRMLTINQLVVIFEDDHPDVTSGKYNKYGFTPNEWKTYLKRLDAQRDRPLTKGTTLYI